MPERAATGAASFDAHAASYDAVALSSVGRCHRARVHERLDQVLAGRDRADVIDLGCGTGLDAEWLAERGANVLAVDPSAEMRELTRARCRHLDGVIVAAGDLDRVDELDVGDASVDIVLADFGVVNCASDLPGLGRWLRRVLRDGGVAVFVAMTPRCPPELLEGVLGRNRGLLTRRRRSDHDGYPGLHVRYLTAGSLADELGLRLRSADALGTVLPTFEQRRLVEARPRTLRLLDRIDRAIAPAAVRLGLGDHHLAVLDHPGSP
ncbi:MAG: methyltransferase domain-containing protein [Actinomycetota bacterium]